jgi:hypothetical protein
VIFGRDRDTAGVGGFTDDGPFVEEWLSEERSQGERGLEWEILIGLELLV